MALEYSLLFSHREDSLEDLLLFALNEMGFVCNKKNELPKGFLIDEFIVSLGFSIALIDTSDFSFGFESNLLHKEFVYMQSLSFRVSDKVEWTRSVENMLKIVFKLLNATTSDALLEFNGEEIWFVKKDEVYFINEELELWNNERISSFLTDLKIMSISEL
jgi:hypothetical protein